MPFEGERRWHAPCVCRRQERPLEWRADRTLSHQAGGTRALRPTGASRDGPHAGKGVLELETPGRERIVVRPGESVRSDAGHSLDVVRPEASWVQWPVYWSAIWVGALAALVAALLIGLIAIAVGAHEIGPSPRIVSWHDFGFGALIFGVLGTFLAFALGGWIAGRIAGLRRAEPAMLHAGIVWLLVVPLLVVLAALGAGSFFGNWFGGLAGVPVWVTPGQVAADPNAAAAARNSALGAVTALLLGLVGSVIGGWLASGERMSPTHYRTRDHDFEMPAVERRAA